jgi:micrococcal nuclease
MNLNTPVNPKQYMPLIKDIFRVFNIVFKSNKKTRNVLGIILFIFLIGLFVIDYIYQDTHTNQNNSLSLDSNLENNLESNINSNSKYNTMVRVIDGDTIVVDINGKEEKVRLIGVNTPESVDPRRDVECFGKESTQYLESILRPDTKIYLEEDKTQNTKDRYNRLLRYVYTEDNTLINKEIIKNGYGYEYTYDKEYTHQKEFKDAQLYAEKNKLGLWGYGVCVR